MSGLNVSLQKRVDNVFVNLQKRTSKRLTDVNVNLCLDVSGSTRNSFASYSQPSDIQLFMERIFSVSKAIDDDGILNFSLFDTSNYNQPELVVEQEYSNLSSIVANIYNNSNYWGGTSFSPPLKALNNKLFETTTLGASLKSFFGIAKPKTQEASTTKQLIIFVTDGECSDYEATRQMLKTLSEKSCFIQFVSIGSANRFLQDCAKSYPNVDYALMSSFNQDDDKTINTLLSDKLISFFGE